MLFIKSTNSNALAVAFFLLSTISLSEARFRRAAIGSNSMVAVASSACPSPTTVTVTQTVSADSAASTLASTATPSSNSVVAPTSVVSTPIATPLSSSTTTSSASTLSATSFGSSTSNAPPAVASPSPGVVNIRSNCTYNVYYLVWSAKDTTESWLPLPDDGLNFTFSNSPWFNGSALQVMYSFSKTQDSGGAAGTSQLGVKWCPKLGEVVYELSEQENQGTSPFEADGYSVSPTPATTAGYPECNILSCAPGEHPCADSYQPGEVMDYSNKNKPWGQKTNSCPDSINLSFELCSN